MNKFYHLPIYNVYRHYRMDKQYSHSIGNPLNMFYKFQQGKQAYFCQGTPLEYTLISLILLKKDQETASRKSQLTQNSDLHKEICHFDCGKGSIKTLVTAFVTGPFDCLFDVVSGQNSENSRNSCFKYQMYEPFATLGGNIFKMGIYPLMS
jgi:hypothetical protein